MSVFRGLLLAACLPAATLAQRPTIDYNHPKNFLRVFELTRKSAMHPLLEAYDTTDPAGAPVRDYTDAISAAVSRNSRIVIEFDRAWIRKNAEHLDVAMGITAVVNGAKESRPVEVPGYSVIGEKSEKAVARIHSARALLTMVRELAIKEPANATRLQTAVKSVIEKGVGGGRDEVIAAFRDNGIALTAVLERIVDSSRVATLRGVAMVMERDPDVLMARARVALGVLKQLATTTAPSDAAILEAAAAIAPLTELAAQLQDQTRWKDAAQQVTDYYLASLKDTDILVVSTGAKVGEEILVTFTNNPGDNEKLRSLTIRLRVSEFGMVRTVSDGTLLLRRNGIDRGRGARDLAAATDRVRDTGDQETVVVQEPVQFTPTGGTTLTWVKHSRTEWIDFFRPGFGLNVSFARFPTTTTVLSRGDGGKIEQSVTRSDRIDITAGAVVSLFENALQFTWGWNLTSEAPRSYVGLGFSFLSITEKIAALSKKD